MRIPKSLKEVLVKDYIQINKIRSAEYDNPFTRTIDLLCIFNKREDVLKCKPSELAIDLSHLLVEPSRILKQYFTINGKRYGIVNHINDLEAGQYMSFTTYLKGFADNPNVHIEQMADILASVIFPVDKNNKVMAIEPSYFRNLADDIRNTMSIEDAYPIAVFFCNLSRSLMSFTQDYLSQKMESMTEQSRSAILEVAKDLESDGAGLPPSIASAMEILRKDPITKK
tara:strand:+ start:3219 stop:3899 length:681 start_codon:yes stop_codon:yes gene_type:complete